MKSRSRSSVVTITSEPVTILEEAQGICDAQRNVSYGEPLDNHTVTADLLNSYFAGRYNAGQFFVGPEEVCILNILQKVARTVHGGYDRNSLVDIAGYAYNVEKIQIAREERRSFKKPGAA